MTTATPTPTVEHTTITNRLNANVGAALDLYSQIKQAHWNVTGPAFIALHELFDTQAGLILGYVDKFAERMRALDAFPAGTVRQAAEASNLPEMPAGELPEADAVRALLARFAALAATVKESAQEAGAAGDIATEDLYIEALRELDQQAWFLRAHLR